jgi:hypothetical protein
MRGTRDDVNRSTSRSRAAEMLSYSPTVAFSWELTSKPILSYPRAQSLYARD